ncbi:thiamine ABC transporter ATP-binding protein [Ursidibacter sp. B-7004-1]
MIQMNVEFDYPELPMKFKLNIAKGERVAVIGESGSGKSTLLNLIAGFELASRGEVYLAGQNHTHTQPAERPVSMLFQDNNLFPHLTVSQNIGLGLTPSLRLSQAQNEKVEEIAYQMGIADFLSRRADKLSGGQKQRVALARTLLRDKPIFLLDEPFSALDPIRREELQELVYTLCIQKNLTLLMVTHQYDEVKQLFTSVIRVESGKIIDI